MSIYARLLMNRRAGDRIKADSILRDGMQDVVVSDLSCKGCCVSVDPAPLVGEAVIIDLLGIGARPAQVAWAHNGSAGLIFDRPLTDDEVGILRVADGPVDSSVPRMSIPADQLADDDQVLSPLRRLGIIISAAICAWCIAIILIWVVMRLV